MFNGEMPNRRRVTGGGVSLTLGQMFPLLPNHFLSNIFIPRLKPASGLRCPQPMVWVKNWEGEGNFGRSGFPGCCNITSQVGCPVYFGHERNKAVL